MVHWLPYQRNVKRETLAHFYFCVERERELCDSAFLLDRIFKWHQLSLNDNEIQHKATQQTEKECSWTLSPWLTRASFMLLQPLSCVNVLYLETSVRLVCCDEKRLFTFNQDWKSQKRLDSVALLQSLHWAIYIECKHFNSSSKCELNPFMWLESKPSRR